MYNNSPTTVETIYEAANLFEFVGMLERRLAKRTKREYRKDVNDFIEYLESKKVYTIREVTLEHMKGFQDALRRSGCKQSTVRRKSFAIKVFSAFLISYGVIPKDIAEELIPPPPPGFEPRCLTMAEYEELLYVCSRSVRDTALIQLFLQTGMRLSELSELRLADLNLPRSGFSGGTVTVRRRNGTLDAIPLTEKAMAALVRYLNERPDVHTDVVFLSKQNRPLNKRSVQFLVTEYLKKARIEHASVHSLRHTMATHHAAKGTDLKVIQDTLGLSSLAQAEQYEEIARQAQRKAIEENSL
jgi:site-specific recombinase XerD